MNRYIRRGDEVFLIKKGVLLMTEEDKDSTWGRLRDTDHFIVHEGDILFYQREGGSQECMKFVPIRDDDNWGWQHTTPDEFAIAKAYLLLAES